MLRGLHWIAIVGCLAGVPGGCNGEGNGSGGGDSDGPVDVTLGETTLVIAINPVVNDVTTTAPPAPGAVQSGVELSLDEGPSVTSDALGVAVLAPVPAGDRLLTLSTADIDGEVAVTVVDKDLRELALAADGSTADVMLDVRYPFGGSVIEVEPTMTVAEINDALSMSNTIVFFGEGDYEGDFSFSGHAAVG
jgi:hypothetical protein